MKRKMVNNIIVDLYFFFWLKKKIIKDRKAGKTKSYLDSNIESDGLLRISAPESLEISSRTKFKKHFRQGLQIKISPNLFRRTLETNRTVFCKFFFTFVNETKI